MGSDYGKYMRQQACHYITAELIRIDCKQVHCPHTKDCGRVRVTQHTI